MVFGGYGTGLEKTKIGSIIGRGYYEAAGYDVFGYWWIAGYFWNGIEYTS